MLKRVLHLFFRKLFFGFCGVFLYTHDILSNGAMSGESISTDVEESIHSMICLEYPRDIRKNLVGIACLQWIKCELWNLQNVKQGDCLSASQ